MNFSNKERTSLLDSPPRGSRSSQTATRAWHRGTAGSHRIRSRIAPSASLLPGPCRARSAGVAVLLGGASPKWRGRGSLRRHWYRLHGQLVLLGFLGRRCSPRRPGAVSTRLLCPHNTTLQAAAYDDGPGYGLARVPNTEPQSSADRLQRGTRKHHGASMFVRLRSIPGVAVRLGPWTRPHHTRRANH